MCVYTVWLQIFVKQYFHDFHEFHNNHENLCREIFLKTAYSTGLDSSKSQKINESRKHARSRKYKTTKIWSYMVLY